MRARLWIASGFITSVCLFGAASSRAAGADPTAATPEQGQQAQTHFQSGKDLASKNQLDAALAEFRASYDAVASPNAHLSIARTLRDMGKLTEAYVEYAGVIAEAAVLNPKVGDRYKPTADAATDERSKVEAQISLLSVTVMHPTDGATLKVGAATIDHAQWGMPIPLMPGAVDVVLESGGKEVARSSTTLAPGEKKSVSVDTQPPPAKVVPVVNNGPVDPKDQPDWKGDRTGAQAPASAPSDRSNLRPYAYVAAGIGAAGLITFGIFGLMEQSTFSGLQDSCHGVCPPSKSSDISAGRTQETVANIGLVVGAVGAAAGITLFVLSMPSKSSSAPKTGSASLVVTPSWIGLRGTL